MSVAIETPGQDRLGLLVAMVVIWGAALVILAGLMYGTGGYRELVPVELSRQQPVVPIVPADPAGQADPGAPAAGPDRAR